MWGGIEYSGARRLERHEVLNGAGVHVQPGYKACLDDGHIGFWRDYYATSSAQRTSLRLDERLLELSEQRQPGVLDALIDTLVERHNGKRLGSFIEHVRTVWLGQQYSYALDRLELEAVKDEIVRRKAYGTPPGRSGVHNPITGEEQEYDWR